MQAGGYRQSKIDGLSRFNNENWLVFLVDTAQDTTTEGTSGLINAIAGKHSAIIIEGQTEEGAIELRKYDIQAQLFSTSHPSAFSEGWVSSIRTISTRADYVPGVASYGGHFSPHWRSRVWSRSTRQIEQLHQAIIRDQINTAKGIAESFLNAERSEDMGYFVDQDALLSLELHIMPALPEPERLSRHPGQYIFIEPDALHYVRTNGAVERVAITDMPSFKSSLETIRQGKNSIILTRESARTMITLNGGHEPDPPRFFVPHRAGQTPISEFLTSCDVTLRTLEPALPLTEEQIQWANHFTNVMLHSSLGIQNFVAQNMGKMRNNGYLSGSLISFRQQGAGSFLWYDRQRHPGEAARTENINCTTWCRDKLALIGITDIAQKNKPAVVTLPEVAHKCNIM